MRNIFNDLAEETLPEIPMENTDINEEECDDDWVRLINESFTDLRMTALLEEESMDVDEDVVHQDYVFLDVVDNVLNNV